jgi:hypothetical protein
MGKSSDLRSGNSMLRKEVILDKKTGRVNYLSCFFFISYLDPLLVIFQENIAHDA